MHCRSVRQLAADDGAAIGAIYAISLFGLIAMAGVGFDYARVMALDTELQNAADQAALAAASQLDGQADAITRARAAANDHFASTSSNYTNRTRLSNIDDDGDGNTRLITGVSYNFYDDYANDTPGNLITDDTNGADAEVVEVIIANRVVRYALTPIVGAIFGNATASAMAGLESAICKVPPLMVCVPPDTPTKKFPEDYIGDGVLMQPGSQVGSWEPGVFGYLDFGNGANMIKQLLGNNEGSDICSVGSNVDAQPGNIASAPDYLNTRFDVFRNSLSCDATSGDRCPATNTRKDFVRVEEWEFNAGSYPNPARPACDKDLTGSNAGGIKVSVGDFEYKPGYSGEGFPRDTCHYGAGSCAANKYGDGDWGRNAWVSSVGISPPSSAQTRWEVYKWERDNGSSVAKYVNSDADAYSTKGGNKIVWTNYCSYTDPVRPPASSVKDRRLITIAAVNCTGKTGGKSFTINEWVDMFLVEPSENRGDKNTQQFQIYGEIVGPGTRPDGGPAFQYYGRNRVVLLR